MKNENKKLEKSNSKKNLLKLRNTDYERFICAINSQVEYLKTLCKQNKAIAIRNRDMLLNDLRNSFWHAYISKTLNYKEYQDLLQEVRESFSWDTLCGFKQLSIFDTLPDEYFGEKSPMSDPESYKKL